MQVIVSAPELTLCNEGSVQILALPLVSCVTLGSDSASLCLNFSTCKKLIITVSPSWECCGRIK